MNPQHAVVKHETSAQKKWSQALFIVHEAEGLPLEHGLLESDLAGQPGLLVVERGELEAVQLLLSGVLVALVGSDLVRQLAVAGRALCVAAAGLLERHFGPQSGGQQGLALGGLDLVLV